MDGLDRLYFRLVHTLRSQDPDGTDGPVTVADLYQHLVPFRAVQHDLGFGELPEYERALLRLLAGERDYVQLEAPHARAELRLNPELLPAAPPADTGQEPEPLPLLADVPAGDPEALPWLSEPEGPDDPRCWTCKSVLPAGVEVRFCPYCGVVQQPLPCAGCEAMLEPSWSFCICCGLARQSSRS